MPEYKLHLGEKYNGRYLETAYRGYEPVSISLDDFETCEEYVVDNIKTIHFPVCKEVRGRLGRNYITHYGLSEDGFIVTWYPLTNRELCIEAEDKPSFEKGNLRLPAFSLRG
ncbi:MAG: hypothetical protein GY841_00960 [FCB group bacterium]|nr:hypothetical protein [FCB group bacterium]